mgnify:CR=1 FL=1
MKYPYDLYKDRRFESTNNLLTTKLQELKAMGYGNKPNRAEPLTESEEEHLWREGILGGEDPKTLVNTMWWITGKYFGLRASESSQKMLMEDIELKADEHGNKYLCFNERKTKTRQGKTRDCRAFKPKAFELPSYPERCPVRLYQKYISHRPSDYNRAQDPFFVQINHSRKDSSNIWYKRQPLGINSMKNIMKEMAKAGNIPGRKTNSTVRKTTITRLCDNNVEHNSIAHLSGHKNLNSIRSYANVSLHHQELMSDILSGKIVNAHNPLASAMGRKALEPAPSTISMKALEPAPSASNTCSTTCIASSVSNTEITSNLSQSTSNITSQTLTRRDLAGLFAGATITGGTINIAFGGK